MSRQGRVWKRPEDDLWAFDVDVNPPGAKRCRRERRGFGTKGEARAEMEVEKSRYAAVRNPTTRTVGNYLTEWVEARVSNGRIRQSTARGYRGIMLSAAEWFAGVRLDRLNAADQIGLSESGVVDFLGASTKSASFLGIRPFR